MKKPIIIPGIISFIMLIIAIPKGLPYDYYIVLRWVICASAIYICWYSYENKNFFWVWPIGIIAVLFNPLMPVYLDKSTWVIIDTVSSVVIISSIFFIKEKS